ncbi:hypothetical protein [Cupriavidus necator]|uniref:hypothetical protein n=1 Tax=Cupriavidus necator TaxID=106590 RepID=UPI0009C2A9F9|nr:hypothetical protein [Cupriavidus necator]
MHYEIDFENFPILSFLEPPGYGVIVPPIEAIDDLEFDIEFRRIFVPVPPPWWAGYPPSRAMR